ncbi:MULTISPECIES: ribonuclease Z [unclassified Exiguobacterium]|uniref:ribonuclease Z n=1 Tax=unclassified Exiguobacterium TaxID=2644629 RepID=UPI00103A22A1|nr:MULTISPECIES: ribonuclease Z [unclassified Exiguobacterium]TCI25214.1 ribonuclease Z [Exiguobacterium sp. SH5S4]TCI39673.1 ribonuclease Z [Exiguobacterium sp. SH4S7]TCI47632.1 ribonuclease Z [Exiguobacterium sp. SH5S32]TCI54518.1 ribonuclease Z [Exiguobacterium sp. SH1S4]TCI61368.1 ribonuclease Z [Exiguobacterium sp. SH0S2]
MKLHFLGTGSGMPSKQRNVSGLALTLPKQTWLIDCGEATQHQILHTTIKPRKVSAVWITHLHGDHVFGLPGFLSTRSALDGKDPLTLYGPRGIKQWLELTLKLTGSYLGYDLTIVEYEDGDTFEQDGHLVTVRKLAHRFPSYGFRIEAPARPGTLLVDKVRALGIPSGPVYRTIKQADTFEFAGKTYASKEYVTESVRGAIVAILGDTTPCENAFVLAQAADVLVHEATFMQGESKLARQYGHSTTVEAARLANEAGAGRLIVTHISARYQGREAEFEAEVVSGFADSHVATDFSEFIVGD